MNYLKVTQQELNENSKETNISNREHEKEKRRETIRKINKHCSPTIHWVESPGWENMTNLST